MEVKLRSTAVDCYYKTLSETIRKEESQDSVVPDTLPDIGRILSTSGNVLIRSKDVAEGRIRLEANIPAKIVYVPEDGAGAYCLEVNLPLYASLENEAIRTGSVCNTDLKLVSLETRMLNPRKISVRAEAEFRIDCYEFGKMEFSGAPEEKETFIHVQERTAVIMPLQSVGEKTFVLTDEFMLPESKPAAANVLSQYTQLQTDEMKIVGTKIIMKGTAKSWLLYMSDDMTPAACEFSTGFSQIIDTETMPDDPYPRVSLLLSGAYYDVSAGDGRTLNMELHLVMQAVVSGKEEVSYLSDVYSNSLVLAPETEMREISTIRREMTLRETLREMIATPEPISEVLLCSYDFGNISMDGDNVLLPVNVNLQYKTAEGSLGAVKQRFHAKFTPELEKGETLEVGSAAAQELFIAPGVGGAELRLPLELGVTVCGSETINSVASISYDENELIDLSDQPTLVLMRASGGDDLWNLAKENHSTVEAITEANGLDTLGPDWKQMILIPKVV